MASSSITIVIAKEQFNFCITRWIPPSRYFYVLHYCIFWASHSFNCIYLHSTEVRGILYLVTAQCNAECPRRKEDFFPDKWPFAKLRSWAYPCKPGLRHQQPADPSCTAAKLWQQRGHMPFPSVICNWVGRKHFSEQFNPHPDESLSHIS